MKVLLVQDRPVLGGNASAEIRVWCAGEARYGLVKELRSVFMNRDVNMPLCDARSFLHDAGCRLYGGIPHRSCAGGADWRTR